jgi:hypothetical protein
MSSVAVSGGPSEPRSRTNDVGRRGGRWRASPIRTLRSSGLSLARYPRASSTTRARGIRDSISARATFTQAEQ